MYFAYGITIVPLREVRTGAGVTTLVDGTPIPGCGWQPVERARDATRPLGSQHADVVTGRKLFAPPGCGLVSGQRVRFPDTTVWEVVENAGLWQSPFTGWSAGDDVLLRRVTPPH